ncbi:MAG: type II toxin-antitoxin system VapC family toxin [Spirochaetes bacterium]|nr:type II toxin-antitoxin system VapC family toxin [Spirochaetota bacterium]
MKILLDTSAFLWSITGNRALGKKAAKAFLDEKNSLLLSVASLWEITIKVCIGKLDVPRPVSNFLLEQLQLNAITLLEISPEHVFGLESLPIHHGDPFDRLIISQCLVEKIPVITGDAIFRKYSVRVIW